MRMPDVTILVYAHRRDCDCHEFFRDRLEALVNGPEPFALSCLVALAFLRVVTHRDFPSGPTPLVEAATVIDSLRARRRCRWLPPGPRHWEIARHLCLATASTGKAVADAQHAAIAIEHGCTWLTRDRDFTAFQPLGLRLELLEP